MNSNELTSINSVCTSARELIQSEDFLRGIRIILRKVNNFEEENIYPIFEKLSKLETLTEEEKESITTFFQDQQVRKKGQQLLSSLRKIPNKVETENHDKQVNFTNFLSEILDEKTGYERVQQCVGEVTGIVDLKLNKFDGFDIVEIEGKLMGVKLVTEIDESDLNYTLSNGSLSNYPEAKIRNNPRLVTKNKRGSLHFGHTASEEENKRQGGMDFGEVKKLIIKDDKVIPEIQKYIKSLNSFHGYRRRHGNGFGDQEGYLCLWLDSVDGGEASYLFFSEGDSGVHLGTDYKSTGRSLLILKDLSFLQSQSD